VSCVFRAPKNNFATDLILESSFGPAKVKALFDQRLKIKKNIMSKQSSTILIFENSSKQFVWKITGNATIKGSGLNPKQLMPP
jgi:hypothetical protein